MADLSTKIGSIDLHSPVLTASGTAGHGAELGAYFDLASLGAVVVKSLSHEPWAGNPAPRVAPTASGMINSVGLQGPGIAAWAQDDLPELIEAGANVVVSIWGHSLDDYAKAAAACAELPPEVIAVEVNVSCPNVESHGEMFAASPDATNAVLTATEACGRPRWAKLSPHVSNIAAIAAGAVDGGAEALTIANTMLGLVIDIDTRKPALGGGGGGLSGAAIHPVSVRAVYDVCRALPDIDVIGLGGVSKAEDAIEFIMAGAAAVGVGTATFADPRACANVLAGMHKWCDRNGVGSLSEIRRAAL